MRSAPTGARGAGRSIAALLRGLLALATIVVLLVGIPAALYVVSGNPLPDSVPSLDDITSAFTQQDDGSLFLGALTWIAWIGWASFAISLLIEIPAALRGVRAPRLPALGFQQRAASGLVAAAAVLFTVGPVGAIASAAEAAPTTYEPTAQVSTAQAPTTDEVTGQPVADQNAPAAPATTPAASTQAPAAEAAAPPTYVVATGDSLWRIAEKQLGDGARWTEIADLNYGIEQPGGYALDETNWIDPGWTLILPSDAASAQEATPPVTGAAEQVVVERGDTLWEIADDELGDGTRYPELFDASAGTVQPGGQRLTDPDVIQPGWTITIPASGEVTPEPPVVEPPPPDQPPPPDEPPPPEEPPPPNDPPTDEDPPVDEEPPPNEEENNAGGNDDERPQDEEPPVDENQDDQVQPPADDTVDTGDTGDETESGVPVRTIAGVGALLAAGILAYLAAKRRSQQRHRKPGQRIAMPTGEVAEVERDLRSVADPMSVETVDLALRSLAASCAATGATLPPLRLGRLTAEQFELYLTEDAELPAPFVATSAGHVWTLPSSARHEIDPASVEGVTAPYPSLVTIGQGPEDGHLLVDLERLGTLALVGREDHTRAVLAALAVELATSPWADDLQVTLVGACEELARGLDTGRIRYVPTLGGLLDELKTRAEQDRQALSAGGADSLDDARARGVAAATWTPEIILLAESLDATQHDQLAELVDDIPRVAVAAVTSSDVVGDWSVDIDRANPDVAVLHPIDVQVSPQRLDAQQYQQVLELLGIAEAAGDDLWTDDSPEPQLADLPVRGEPTTAAPAGPATRVAAGSVAFGALTVDDEDDEPPSAPSGGVPPVPPPDDDLWHGPQPEDAGDTVHAEGGHEGFAQFSALDDEPAAEPAGTIAHAETVAEAAAESGWEAEPEAATAGFAESDEDEADEDELAEEELAAPDDVEAGRAEAEAIEAERALAEAEAIEAERALAEAEQAAADDEAAERAAAEQAAADMAEIDRLEAERAEAQRREAERAEAERAEAERAEAARVEAERIEADRAALAIIEAGHVAAEREAAEREAAALKAAPSAEPAESPGFAGIAQAAATPSTALTVTERSPGSTNGSLAIDSTPSAGTGPSILLLGLIDVESADGPFEQSKYRQLSEIAAFIALNPGLGHAALDEAIWPGNPVTQNTRNTAISKLRRWFGRDAQGNDYLPRVDAGYRFHDAVTTDWQLWGEWVGPDPRETPTDRLVEALQLVRGQPFAGVGPRRYAWAEHLKQEMISAIVDAAHELALRGLGGGDARLARRAATIGLQVEPGMELLWRDRLKAEHIAGNRDGINDAIKRLTAITDDLGGDMEDATIALLDELMPQGSRTRSTAAVPYTR